MKLKMLIGMAGAKFSLSPREITDRFSEREAQDLIVAGYAEEVLEERPIKTEEEWQAEMADLATKQTELEADLVAARADLAAGQVEEKRLGELMAAGAAVIQVLTADLAASVAREAELTKTLEATMTPKIETTEKPAAEVPKSKAAKAERADKVPAAEKRD